MPDALVVSVLPTAFTLDVSGATLEDGEQNDVCFEADNTLWHALTLPDQRQVQLEATGSDFEAGFVVYTAAAPRGLSGVEADARTIVTLALVDSIS